MQLSIRLALATCVLSCALADADAESVQAADWLESLSITGAAQQAEAVCPRPCCMTRIFACRPEPQSCRPDPVCAPQLCRPEPQCYQPDFVCATILCRPEPRLCHPEPVCVDPEPRCRAACSAVGQPSLKSPVGLKTLTGF